MEGKQLPICRGVRILKLAAQIELAIAQAKAASINRIAAFLVGLSAEGERDARS